MDYCTLEQVKAYVGIQTGTVDDSLLQDFITKASEYIENLTNRKFYAYEDVRYYNALTDIVGRRLYVDEDLLAVIGITASGEALDIDDLYLVPANRSPHYAIDYLATDNNWSYEGFAENAIAVNGTWGFNVGSVAPTDVQQAAILLTTFYYRQKNSPNTSMGAGPQFTSSVQNTNLFNAAMEILQVYIREVKP